MKVRRSRAALFAVVLLVVLGVGAAPVGPASATTNAVALYADGTGKLLTTSPVEHTAGPNVVATSPVDGATAVGANTPVVVEFDEAVDPGSVTNETFLVRGGLVEILGSFEVSQDGRVATLKPFTFLRTGVEHEVRLDGITDVSGNPMAPNLFHFTTVDRGNLARTSGVLITASTQFSASFPPTALIDGNLNTSWFTANESVAAGASGAAFSLVSRRRPGSLARHRSGRRHRSRLRTSSHRPQWWRPKGQ